MTSFGNQLHLWARTHLLLGKFTRFVFYASLVLLGWYYIDSADALGTEMENIKLGQIFNVLIGLGIIIIALFAFFHFPEEANPLAEYGIYRTVWGNLGIFIIIICALIYGWLFFYNHFDRPFFERIILLYNEQSTRGERLLNYFFKK
ncbi:hypothetical protein A3H10_03030 [Candidatus Uhrbacteria bacterium RIFCSPLOWO2_12_FULL_46_10]|uniref:Uncharacterized protein n=1 Tax=Candidatus Uhrbacteria bacterium RIFCSPLOWO2_01_FULL_47_25 TaxID=1802402 RepID=A0A1F7UZB4_9BACT|nr:MAG: hypothetical protein UX68_C0022G0014 [Parcubacteria group bacterium GW2011_GWA2_46_9]OGL59748.1 MAG: hypothetical protein A2752_03105 [Candidatus Uhrbacteria bacterium RIFCSPHIGHO2_01_FULL_46_23]OGL70544.1 MAG: hypothetical protein A3D60_03675 [Candidatus Uhrbacteria bacterium RIFCSPHIGHO2_02_FULL_47_29]OGL75121.1 MAG: hypothetical protein A3E96_04235 [Candidatus Uhrbacteria bacterium RIFCSPHIGHO2_12_FULL_46_13]OGL83077.1 MAG: hypothetical protein A2936_05180 [Candidatus Uhrbacteria bac